MPSAAISAIERPQIYLGPLATRIAFDLPLETSILNFEDLF